MILNKKIVFFSSRDNPCLREKNKSKALQAYKEGRLTIRQCAELIGVDYYEMNDLLSEANIPIIEAI